MGKCFFEPIGELHGSGESLLVDCLGCGVALPWAELKAQDGRCTACGCKQILCPTATDAADASSYCEARSVKTDAGDAAVSGEAPGCRSTGSSNVDNSGAGHVSKTGRWRR